MLGPTNWFNKHTNCSNSGTPPYAYSWTGPNFYSNNIDEDIDSLYAGTYSLTITDANGCTRFMEIVS